MGLVTRGRGDCHRKIWDVGRGREDDSEVVVEG